MQIQSLRIKSYRSWKIDEREICDIARLRRKKLEIYTTLRAEGCSESSALKAVEVSRSTLYRWQAQYRSNGVYGLSPKSKRPKIVRKPCWSKQVEQQVQHLRRQHPLWGKRTLWAVLRRDKGLKVSESTVGRILKKLVRLSRVKPVCFYYGRTKPKRARVFDQHAKRWKKGMKAKTPGQLVQVDHMSVYIAQGFRVKHFEATCPITKITVCQAYKNATSKTAAQFLALVKQKMPFAIESIQVDGGSEFRKDFEEACAVSDVELFVLPPRSPELNGCVERCNRTLRYEFYQLYDGLLSFFDLRKALVGYMKLYNTFRPHQALNLDTPLSYYQKLLGRGLQSHMS